jgi:hypothetical protein
MAERQLSDEGRPDRRRTGPGTSPVEMIETKVRRFRSIFELGEHVNGIAIPKFSACQPVSRQPPATVPAHATYGSEPLAKAIGIRIVAAGERSPASFT